MVPIARAGGKGWCRGEYREETSSCMCCLSASAYVA